MNPMRGEFSGKSLSGQVCLVGADEADEIGVVPHKSTLQLQAEAVRNALNDAGLKKDNVDGLFTAGQRPSVVCDYLGIKPSYVDGTMVGGCSFIIHVEHAVLAIANGLINVAVIVHGESGRSKVGMMRPVFEASSPSGQFELPFGALSPASLFALSASRHMTVYGTTQEHLAEVAVAQRKWAAMHPKALMRDKGPITIQQVLKARIISWPFTLPMCCLVTDAAGALVLTSSERARDLKQRPVYVLGTGEAVEHHVLSQMEDLTTSRAARVSGERAFRMAGLTSKDIDVAELYDAFAYTPMLALEDLGFCRPGESGPFVSRQRTAPGGAFPMNTNGGGLSYTHSGMYSVFALIECVRQLRGTCGPRQVPRARFGIVHGPGGLFWAAGTAILGNQRGD